MRPWLAPRPLQLRVMPLWLRRVAQLRRYLRRRGVAVVAGDNLLDGLRHPNERCAAVALDVLAGTGAADSVASMAAVSTLRDGNRGGEHEIGPPQQELLDWGHDGDREAHEEGVRRVDSVVRSRGRELWPQPLADVGTGVRRVCCPCTYVTGSAFMDLK